MRGGYLRDHGRLLSVEVTRMVQKLHERGIWVDKVLLYWIVQEDPRCTSVPDGSHDEVQVVLQAMIIRVPAADVSTCRSKGPDGVEINWENVFEGL